MGRYLYHVSHPTRKESILRKGLIVRSSSINPQRYSHEYPLREAAEKLRNNLLDEYAEEKYGEVYPRRNHSTYYMTTFIEFGRDYEQGAHPIHFIIAPEEFPERTFFKVERDPVEDLFGDIRDAFKENETCNVAETELERDELEERAAEIVEESLGPWHGEETTDIEVWCEGSIPPEQIHLYSDVFEDSGPYEPNSTSEQNR